MVKIEYKIIDKEDIPEVLKILRFRWHKWRNLFIELPENKAIKFNFDRERAQAMQNIILGTFRPSRIRNKLNFRIHTKMIAKEDGTLDLFVWKKVN